MVHITACVRDIWCVCVCVNVTVRVGVAQRCDALREEVP